MINMKHELNVTENIIYYVKVECLADEPKAGSEIIDMHHILFLKHIFASATNHTNMTP